MSLPTTTMHGRLVRYADLRPCTNAFVDSRSPGSDRKENFTIIGPGVSENPDQYVHIPEPHGFNIGAARQPPGCLNSQHSHETAEVFVVHTGQWRFTWGVDARDGSVELGPGDVISLPIHMFRGFENIGQDVGFLFAVLGGDDPGKVTWAPQVFDMARTYGLVLLEGGRLVDTTLGETVPPDARRQSPPDAAAIARLASPDADRMASVVAHGRDLTPNPRSALASSGVEEAAVIGPRAAPDGFAPGPIAGWWPHGFAVRRLRIAPGARTPWHARQEAEVLLMHEGVLELTWPGGSTVLGPGDTATVPVGMEHAFASSGDVPAVAFVVRGNETPAAPRMVGQAAA